MEHSSSQSADQHLCYVRCNFCNTILAVGIPYRRLIETVTVKCGHCGNVSFLSTKSPVQVQPPSNDHHQPPVHQALSSSDLKKVQTSTSLTISTDPPSPKFVVKPPEKKHRLPSAYNRFMKEEIQRIKEAHPEIPHREAFSAAAKNWARYIPSSSDGSVSSTSKNG